jgi:hypothetical protein
VQLRVSRFQTQIWPNLRDDQPFSKSARARDLAPPPGRARRYSVGGEPAVCLEGAIEGPIDPKPASNAIVRIGPSIRLWLRLNQPAS